MNPKRKRAAALSYDKIGSSAPKVTALGEGLIAENIIEQALAHDIPIMEDASLVELLANLNINEAIPEELFQAVAEVFAYVYRLDKLNAKD